MVDEIDVRKKTGILQKNHLQLLGVPHLTAFLYSVPPPPMIHVILITNWKYFMNLGMMAHISGLGKCPDWTYIQIIYIYTYWTSPSYWGYTKGYVIITISPSQGDVYSFSKWRSFPSFGAFIKSPGPVNHDIFGWLVVSTPLNNISHLGWLFPIYVKS